MKRSRLSKKSSRRQERLPELKQSVLLMSNKELTNLVNVSAQKKKSDPILASLSGYAKDEISRRKQMEKIMGKTPARLPISSPVKEFATKFAEEAEKDIREYYKLTKSAFTGGFADEMERFVVKMDKLVEEKFFTTKERWEKALKEHNLLRTTESDYLKAGYSLKTRLDYDINPNLIKATKARFSKMYGSVLVIPVKVDNKKYYSILVK